MKVHNFIVRVSNEEKPGTLNEALDACNPVLYPNVHTNLRLLLITPVTSATVERGNSSLHFVKSYFRSTMGEERLNALLLLFIHRDIPLDYEAAVDEFANRYPRRMTFINTLS